MKKRFWLLSAVTALCFATVGLVGCTKNLTYGNADRYTAGGTSITQEVTAIDVEWLAGNVEVVYGEGSGVTFSETSAEELTTRTMLHYWLEGSVLRIKYAESKKGWSMKDYPQKDLTVALPAALALQKLEISVVSANVELGGVQVNDVEIESVSGKISGSLSESTKELSVETVSGDVELRSLSVGEFDIETTSGDVELQTVQAPRSGSFDSTSGDLKLWLPENTEGFSFEFESLSGDFNSDFDVAKQGDRYVYGSGGGNYEAETTSGSVEVLKLLQGGV